MNDKMSIAFMKVVELAAVLEVRDISKMITPWVHYVDDHWTIAVNGKETSQSVFFKNNARHMDVPELPPYNIAVWWHGWLAGLIDSGGGIIAYGEEANEDTFIQALDNAIAIARERSDAVRLGMGL